ncbi:MAG: TonB-dependent receptor [Myxococcales bacterium]|nr:TonB-dependent receptor [Myxococcales bacterium]
MSTAANSAFALLLLAAVPGVGAQAQTSSGYGAAATVVRSDSSPVHATSSVTRARAQQAGASTPGQMLELMEGVTVQRTTSVSAAPFVRGLTGYRVLIMLDDLRLNTPLTRVGGNALLNLIDPESVERIDVIRGPASVMHGSDALGGVVRVMTRDTGARPRSQPEAFAAGQLRGASAEQLLSARGAVGGVASAFGARLSFARATAGQVVRGDDRGPQPHTGHDAWSLSSRLDAQPAPKHRVSLAHHSGHLFDVPRPDISVPGDVSLVQRLDRDAVVLSYSGRFSDPGLWARAFAGMAVQRQWRQRLRAGETRDERDRVLSYHAGVRVGARPWHMGTLTVGADASLEDIGSGALSRRVGEPAAAERGRYVDASRYDSYGVSALLSQGVGADWTVLVGGRANLVHARAPRDPVFAPELAERLRLDRRMFGLVGSAGVRYELAQDWAWVTSVLSGFRAPNLEDFQALGTGARGFSVPNPELDVERSYTVETGLKGEGRIEFQLFLFATWLSGLVVRVPGELDGMSVVDGRPVRTRRNASDSTLLGGEAILSHHFDSGIFVGASAWATFGRTRRPGETGGLLSEPASKVPPPMGRLRFGYMTRPRRFWVMGTLRSALPQHALSEADKGDTRICEQGPQACTAAPGFAVLSVAAGLQLDHRLTVSLGLENLFDSAYKTYASGAYAPGRNLTLSLRAEM